MAGPAGADGAGFRPCTGNYLFQSGEEKGHFFPGLSGEKGGGTEPEDVAGFFSRGTFLIAVGADTDCGWVAAAFFCVAGAAFTAAGFFVARVFLVAGAVAVAGFAFWTAVIPTLLQVPSSNKYIPALRRSPACAKAACRNPVNPS